ncbi:hypothetical protein ALC57_07147 [Trachymyrmex cornetzi]|uniref:Uncharacterized protein n=1 Tax=Trachymyrmex cornetzi TaxID=471704 RepID=A0A195E507_9HYME|nr:hypothetical protein ALC57_07147 [Trachymyrmex cornetzi]
MHFAFSNELAAHIKSLTKQYWNQMVIHRFRITNREQRTLIRFAVVSSTRDYDLCTTLSIVNPLSRSENPSLTHLEEVDGVSSASKLEAPSALPPRVSNQPM